MAKLLKTNGESFDIKPANGKKFTYKELQEYVGGLIEPVHLKKREVLICNEEGIVLGLPYNSAATLLMQASYGVNAQKLYGDVVYCLERER